MINEELTQESKPWLVFVSIAAFAIILFFSVYYEIQGSRYQSAIADMQAQKQALIAQNQTSNAADRAKAVSAKDYLSDLEKKQVLWSRVIEKVESTIPRRAETLAPVAIFKAYNGSSEGRLAINATTQPDAQDPFTDIAFTIRSFTSDPTFKNVFIPSIARSLTPDGTSVLTFSMNFEYEPSNLIARPRTDATTAPTASAVTSTNTPDATLGVQPTQAATGTPAATQPVAPAKPTTPVKPATPAKPATTPKPVTPTPTN